MYDDLFLFIKVAQFASFTKAARELGIYQSTISRRIANLETELNKRLIVRNANHFELTLAGRRLLDELNQEESLLARKIQMLIGNQDDIRGELKIMLPQVLSAAFISPKIPEFIRQYPNLKLRLYFLNHEINLQKDFIDLAVIYGLPGQNAQKVKRVYKAPLQIFCNPNYIEKYGYPQSLADVKGNQAISVLRDHGELINKINLRHRQSGESFQITVDSQIACNDYLNKLALVDSGEYLAVTYSDAIHKELLSGKYVALFTDYELDRLEFYLLKRVEDDPNINLIAKFVEECFLNGH